MNYWEFQEYIKLNPTRGRVTPGTGGARKIRWEHPARGKGTRGGLRIIYFWFEAHLVIVQVDHYSKGEQADLTTDDRSRLRRLSAKLRKELTMRIRQ